MDEQPDAAKLAVLAAMEEELGIARRNALPVEDRKGWGAVDIEALDKSRKARVKGTEEWRLTQQNSSALSGWKALADMDPDSNDLENINDGQSHRVRMKAEMDSHPPPHQGSHIGRTNAQVARGRGGGFAGSRGSRNGRGNGRSGQSSHFEISVPHPGPNTNITRFLRDSLNIPLPKSENRRDASAPTKLNDTGIDSASSLQSKSVRGECSTHGIPMTKRSSRNVQFTYNLADPAAFLKASLKSIPMNSSAGLVVSRHAPSQASTPSTQQTKDSVGLSLISEGQETSSEKKPVTCNVDFAGSRYTDDSIPSDKKLDAVNVSLAGSRYANQSSQPDRKPVAANVGLAGSRYADSSVPSEKNQLAANVGLASSRYVDQSNVQEQTNPFQARSVAAVNPLAQAGMHGMPEEKIYIDAKCRAEKAGIRCDDARVRVLMSAVDHFTWLNLSSLTRGILLSIHVTSDIKVSVDDRVAKLDVQDTNGQRIACSLLFTSVYVAGDFAAACSLAVEESPDGNPEVFPNKKIQGRDVPIKDAEEPERNNHMEYIEEPASAEQLISFGDSDEEQKPTEPSYSEQILSLMGPDSMDLALDKLDKIAGGDFLGCVMAADSIEEAAQTSQSSHNAQASTKFSEKLDFRGGLAASMYATDTPFKKPEKPVHPDVYTASNVGQGSPKNTPMVDIEVHDIEKAKLQRVLGGGLASSIYANATAEAIVDNMLTESNTFKHFSGKERDSFRRGFTDRLVGRAIEKMTGSKGESSFLDSGAVSGAESLQNIAPQDTAEVPNTAGSDHNTVKPIYTRRFTYTQEELRTYRSHAISISKPLLKQEWLNSEEAFPSVEMYPADHRYRKPPSRKVSIVGSSKSDAIAKHPEDTAAQSVSQEITDHEDSEELDQIPEIENKTVASDSSSDVTKGLPRGLGTSRWANNNLFAQWVSQNQEPKQYSAFLQAQTPLHQANTSLSSQDSFATAADEIQNVHLQHAAMSGSSISVGMRSSRAVGTLKPCELPHPVNNELDIPENTLVGGTTDPLELLEITKDAPGVSGQSESIYLATSTDKTNSAVVQDLSALDNILATDNCMALNTPTALDNSAVQNISEAPFDSFARRSALVSSYLRGNKPSTALPTAQTSPYNPGSQTQQPYEVFWIRDIFGVTREFRQPIPTAHNSLLPMALGHVRSPVLNGSPIPLPNATYSAPHQANLGMQWVQPTSSLTPISNHSVGAPRSPGQPHSVQSGASPTTRYIRRQDAMVPRPAATSNTDSPSSAEVQRDIQMRLERSLAKKNRRKSSKGGDRGQSPKSLW